MSLWGWPRRSDLGYLLVVLTAWPKIDGCWHIFTKLSNSYAGREVVTSSTHYQGLINHSQGVIFNARFDVIDALL